MSKIVGLVVYVIGLKLYQTAIRVLSPFNTRASKMREGRKGEFERIKTTLQPENRKRIWYHCASLGEFEQIRPILERLRQMKSDFAVVVTFFSPSGFDQRKNYPLADYVFYLPFDSKTNAKRMVDLVNPTQVFFAKYDLWYFYLNELKNRGIPVYLVSANFRPTQIYFKWYGAFFKEILFAFTHIFSQFKTSTELLHAIGLKQASTSGDTRFDRVLELAKNATDNMILDGFTKDSFVLVLGSSYDKEDLIAAGLKLRDLNLKLIVAPHHIGEKRIAECENNFGITNVLRYSKANNSNIQEARILILDNMGMLGNSYRYADAAFVGGGFGNNGIHNILEPLAHGVPVLFGPNNHAKYPETILAMNNKVGFCITGTNELDEFIKKSILPKKERENLQLLCAEYVNSQCGATDRIIKALN